VLEAIGGAERAGQALGFTRLTYMTGLNKGSLSRTLKDLADKELISEIEEGGRKCWKLL
jgi:predicted transcriptional regulator